MRIIWKSTQSPRVSLCEWFAMTTLIAFYTVFVVNLKHFAICSFSQSAAIGYKTITAITMRKVNSVRPSYDTFQRMKNLACIGSSKSSLWQSKAVFTCSCSMVALFPDCVTGNSTAWEQDYCSSLSCYCHVIVTAHTTSM